MNVDTAQKRGARQDMTEKVRPQRGVHALSTSYPARAVPPYVKERVE